MRSRSVGFVALAFFLGILLGSVVGQAIGLFVPEGSVAYELFVKPHATPGLGPATIHLIAFDLTLGLTLRANLMSVIGIFVVAQLLRWIR